MAQWSQRFFAMNKSHWRPTTQAAYRVAINKYIIPLIGKQRLNQLTKARYDYLFAQPLLDKLATYTVHNYNILAMTIMNSAVQPIKDASAFNNFHKVLVGAGIPKDKYGIHSLRHTHATLLLDSGVSPVDIAKRLGHADVSITLKIYSHAIEDNNRDLTEKMAKIANL